jgi:hypothetical protein
MLERFSAKLIGLLVLLTAAASVEARAAIPYQVHETFRGTRAQGMGGAFTAVADDEQAVFYNPAGLAGVKKLRLNVLAVDADVSSEMIFSAPTVIDAFKDFTPSSINSLMGKNVYGRGTVSPSVIMPNFGISLLVDSQVAMNLRNQALPDVAVGYQFTNGVQVAGGFSVLGRKSKKNDLRIGLAGKVLWRRGGYNKVPLVKLMNLTSNSLVEMAGSFGMGYGVDIGTQFIRKVNDRLSLSFAATGRDLNDTKFSSEADKIDMNFSLGVAATYEMERLRIIMAYDHRNLFNEIDPRKRSHFGMEFKFPIVSVLWGLHQMYLTYGAGVDLRFVTVHAVSYAEEQGTYVGQDADRRYMLRATLKFGN